MERRTHPSFVPDRYRLSVREPRERVVWRYQKHSSKANTSPSREHEQQPTIKELLNALFNEQGIDLRVASQWVAYGSLKRLDKDTTTNPALVTREGLINLSEAFPDSAAARALRAKLLEPEISKQNALLIRKQERETERQERVAIVQQLSSVIQTYDIPQARLAQLIGVSESTISRWCKGETIPKKLITDKIAAVCQEIVERKRVRGFE